jgi:chloramphenicol O-acetyltransferase
MPFCAGALEKPQRNHWFKTTLPISFQFHHTQMDGAHAAKFLADLQNEINRYTTLLLAPEL